METIRSAIMATDLFKDGMTSIIAVLCLRCARGYNTENPVEFVT